MFLSRHASCDGLPSTCAWHAERNKVSTVGESVHVCGSTGGTCGGRRASATWACISVTAATSSSSCVHPSVGFVECVHEACRSQHVRIQAEVARSRTRCGRPPWSRAWAEAQAAVGSARRPHSWAAIGIASHCRDDPISRATRAVASSNVLAISVAAQCRVPGRASRTCDCNLRSMVSTSADGRAVDGAAT